MAFFWEGNTGQTSTPQQAARKRALAESMLAQSGSGASNWGEGLARVAQALTGTVLEGRASDAERAGADEVAALLAGLSPESGFSDITAALSNPWVAESPGGSSIAQALLSQNMQRNDPMYQMQLERAQMEMDALRNPSPAQPSYDFEGGQWWQRNPDGSVPFAVSEPAPDALTSAIQNYEFLIGQGVDPAMAQQQAFGGQTTNVNVNTGNTNDFFSGLSAAEGENFAGMLEAGNQAARNLSQLGQLETLLAETPQGLEGAATQFAANLGIDLGGAQGVQAAQALINQMVPAQRPPGTGPMSDADLNLYKQSIPRIINQPGGNELIIGTMRAINEYDRQLAAIVQDGVARAEMTDDPAQRAQIRREMRSAIDGLQNPIDVFERQVQAIAQTPAGPSVPQSQANPSVFGGGSSALPSSSGSIDWKDL